MNKIMQYVKNHILKKCIIMPVLILMLVPSAMSIILGIQFASLPYQKIPTIIVNHDDSATALGLVESIRTNDVFDVIEYSGQNEDIEQSFMQNKAMAGILIPEDFSDNLLNGKEAKIMVFNDGAMSPAASSVRGAVAETLGTIKNGYLIKLAQGKLNMTRQEAINTVAPMGYTSRLIGNPTKNIAYMMLEGVLLTSVQVGIVALGSSMRERNSYKSFLAKGIFCAIMGFISAFACIFIQTKIFNFPYRGSIKAGLLLTFFCSLGFSFFGILSNLSAKGDIEGAVSKCSLIGLTMMLSGYTYPVISMPKIFEYIAPFLPNTHYIIPLRDIALMGSTYFEMQAEVLWMAKFALLMFVLATLKFLSTKYARPKIHAKNPFKKVKAVNIE